MYLVQTPLMDAAAPHSWRCNVYPMNLLGLLQQDAANELFALCQKKKNF
jgi:hypothetical protein